MALKTLVKVGSITNLADARYCAGMGVDFLGFRVIEGQNSVVSAKAFQEIRGWITGPQIVTEIYGIQTPDQLSVILSDFLPDYLELSLDDYRKVGSALTLPYILQLRAGDELPSFLSTTPAYILTDMGNNTEISKLIPEYELILRINSASDLESATGHTGISGVALSSGASENSPGLRDFEDLVTILEGLEED